MPRIKSVTELREELAVKVRQLAELTAQRKTLARGLAALDKRIAALGGEAPPAKPRRRRKARRGRKPGRRAAKKAARKVGRGYRAKPLVAYIAGALKKARKGMRARDVAAAVLKAGYPTSSKDFYHTVAKTLATEAGFQRVTRGVYAVAKK